MTGTGSSNAVAGVATKTVTGNLAGSVTLQASATLSGPGSTNSNTLTFNVVHGAASQIVLSGSTADLPSATSRTFTATIQDAAGNTVTTGADSTVSVDVQPDRRHRIGDGPRLGDGLRRRGDEDA